jgi:hypothetical protein
MSLELRAGRSSPAARVHALLGGELVRWAPHWRSRSCASAIVDCAGAAARTRAWTELQTRSLNVGPESRSSHSRVFAHLQKVAQRLEFVKREALSVLDMPLLRRRPGRRFELHAATGRFNQVQ